MPRPRCASASCTRSPTNHGELDGQGRGGRQPGAALLAQAVAETKQLVRASRARAAGAHARWASHTFAAALAGDAREGIRAFVEKRKPAWAKKIEKL